MICVKLFIITEVSGATLRPSGADSGWTPSSQTTVTNQLVTTLSYLVSQLSSVPSMSHVHFDAFTDHHHSSSWRE
ncbi:hypothetical protein INR49_018026 [Caranx melampygus]|nr:hypothetical protein INR49_018026 [Caranx melampygus]